MSVSTPFIRRPVATTLLMIGITIAGCLSYTLLPVSPLPQVDYPTIFVSASLPGGSPEVMAASVANLRLLIFEMVGSKTPALRLFLTLPFTRSIPEFLSSFFVSSSVC